MSKKLPAKWKWAKLNELGKMFNGGTPNTKNLKYWNGEIPWVTGADISSIKVTKGRKNITLEGLENSATNLVPKSAVLIVTRTGVGKIGIADNELTFSQDITALVCNKEIEPCYVARYLNLIGEKIKKFERGATIKGITRDVLNSIEIPIPPLETQRKIVAILEKTEVTKDIRIMADDLTNQLPQNVFLEIFGDPVINNKKWPIQKIKNLCNLVRGSSPRPKGDPKYYGGNIPRLMIQDITRDGRIVTPKIDFLTIDGAKLSRPVNAGTIVMTVSGDVGVTARLAVDACIHDGFVAFKDLKTNIIEPDYFELLLKYIKVTHSKRKVGAIFQNLTTKQINDIEIPIPPLIKQKEFSNFLNKIELLKELQQESKKQFDNIFNTLMQKAFAGELVT